MTMNAQQQRVVDELDRNLLVLASAGTGKTNTLAYRVAHILKSGRTTADRILCMTFTNKACGEMKQRITSLAGADARAVEVSTFHSFCYAILQSESKRNDTLYTDCIVFDEEDCRELWGPLKPERMKDIDFAALLALVKEYRSLYGYYSDNVKADYNRTIKRLYQEEVHKIDTIFGGANNSVMAADRDAFYRDGAAKMVAYEEALSHVHGVDFTDLICQVHRLFQDRETRERWRSRFDYIAVDEMQDTGVLEYRIMESLWEGNRVLLCGDYFQTIYEWRGSDPFLILSWYERKFNPVTIIFHENYRSNATLFTAAFETLQTMFPELVKSVYDEKPHSASTTTGNPIIVHEAKTEQDEGRYIFDVIRGLPQTDSVGVLVRNNRKAQYLSQLFDRLNSHIPEANRREFMIIDEFKFFRRQEIKDVMAYFKLLSNPHDAVSAKRIIKRYVKGIGDARIQDIESPKSREVGLKLTDFLDIKIFEEEPYARLLRALSQDNVVVYDVESTGVDTTKDNIIQIAAIRIDRNGKVLETFERFIKPDKSVGDSEAVHGFSDAQLSEIGESAQVVLGAFTEFAKGRVIVGHNVNYDISILASELQRNGMRPAEFGGVYDTLDIFRRFYPTLPNHKLGFLSEEFPIDHKPTHNAYDDIMATALLLVYAVEHNIVPTETNRMAAISLYKSAFGEIASQMATLRRKSMTEKPSALLAYIMNNMGVIDYYKEHNEMGRVEYIRELYRIMDKLEKEHPDLKGSDRLSYILQLAALTAGEPDSRIKNEDRIPIITVHQAKGSEFDHVFLAGMNQGTFPNFMAVKEGKVDEEKRLFYVALTRPKQALTITYATESSYGKALKPSPFLTYLPKQSSLVVRK